ncbi:DUF6591 domain-containing protein [Floccifex sp.]|uniref:DUF6591 domain-containing protein n=1 Tax=Floccifex sp. TaxID=2815810 RepID=UPI003F129E0B
MKRQMMILTSALALSVLSGCDEPKQPTQPEQPDIVDIQEEKQENIVEEQTPIANGIRPEIKEALDSYEIFMNEYVEFMKTYQESQDTSTLLQQYVEYMTKYNDACKKLDEIDEDSLNDDELIYYLEVQTRVLNKINEIE